MSDGTPVGRPEQTGKSITVGTKTLSVETLAPPDETSPSPAPASPRILEPSGLPGQMSAQTPESAEGTNSGATVTQSDAKRNPSTWNEWLQSTFINAGGIIGALTVNDFLQTTNTAHSHYCWWESSQIEYALSTLRKDYGSLAHDVYIADTFQAEILCKAGNMKNENDAQALFQQTAEDLDELKKNSHKIIIIPVNSGMVTDPCQQGAGPMSPDDVRPQHLPGYRAGANVGCHWSFVIIDTRKKRARYFDPAVIPAKGTKDQWIPGNIEANAPNAGKIAYGFDRLVQSEKGRQYSARTLVWTPNQNDIAEGDPGACGPYCYGFLEYLLNNMRIINDGLDKSFAQEARTGHKRRIIEDHSPGHCRKKLRDRMWKQRLDEEAVNPNLARVNITPELLTTLIDTPERLDGFYKLFDKKVSTPSIQAEPDSDADTTPDDLPPLEPSDTSPADDVGMQEALLADAESRKLLEGNTKYHN